MAKFIDVRGSLCNTEMQKAELKKQAKELF